ncbi:hypothetical protein L228DRAFT_240255 [Xylona heveae TC161]|uniref:WD40 repeat-like protein n=1 Tax=Xylona heveae (strain CBS 132557 / TC161) TaxID=1328760 RepID=A0A165FUH9_XYLHT|nr:hypothetical protein L228DRAFT_240255 [Xylona heveae TC161]KZF21397.1 hypothetical protein L228DRAFT_240255 [Xylona heveae TC161]
MDYDQRRTFVRTPVLVAGVEKGGQRFPTNEERPRPRCAPWRNNLTRNLFFAAFYDKIHVYKPCFPEQALGNEPDLVFSLASSGLNHFGYIDEYHPHAINYLIVSDLGNEEILACVCDDGDVIAYHTRAIFEAVEQSNVKQAAKGATVEDPRPFFVENVTLSAWGLAIHKEARMIAVSANNHEIKVYAFALTGQREESPYLPVGEAPHSSRPPFDGGVSGNWEEYCSDSPRRRDRNWSIDLIGHQTNIPNVAFCNTADDPEGRWLASTDISGVTVIWDVWARTAIRAFHFGHQSLGARDLLLEPTRGWGVFCLDPRSFRVTRGAEETFGCQPQLYKDCWDATAAREKISDTSIWHSDFMLAAVQNYQQGLDAENDMDQSPSEDEGEEEEEEEEEGEEGEDEISAAAGLLPSDTADLYEHLTGDMEMEDDSEEEEEEEDTDDAQPGIPMNQMLPVHGVQEVLEEIQEAAQAAASSPPIHHPTPNVAATPQTAETPTDLSAGTGQVQAQLGPGQPQPNQQYTNPQLASTQSRQTQTQHQPSSISQGHHHPHAKNYFRVPFCLLHTSEVDIRLVDKPSDRLRPSVSIRNPLHQRLPPHLSWLDRFTRLNMLASIPELGLLIIGSQVGRVSIFALTRSRNPPQLAFRLDAILPFKSQEEAGQRPNYPLMGIAVGPVQGREMSSSTRPRAERGNSSSSDDDEEYEYQSTRTPKEDTREPSERTDIDVDGSGSASTSTPEPWRAVESNRRYRLMLTYYDNTVLSYELGRTRYGGGSEFVVIGESESYGDEQHAERNSGAGAGSSRKRDAATAAADLRERLLMI